MMVVVTFVSLCVHVYTIGYMHDDPGYQRFFSYISLFTFSMLMLVMSNNFLQLFFGWEAVGVVSYLLIGFWYKRPTAIFANMKAFLVNRVGDFGFVLGIAGVVYYTGIARLRRLCSRTRRPDRRPDTFAIFPARLVVQAITVICICLFVGAMGKSAQVPLHVWLPDSMEGPTPISALIHAATMVTAGIFMVARMSPLFELSRDRAELRAVHRRDHGVLHGLARHRQQRHQARRRVLDALAARLHDGRRSACRRTPAAIFHLMTHAFFKALLFLAAGSVIIGMHHEQDMRKMGGLRSTCRSPTGHALIGTLALIGVPFFSGFFSKDALIEAVHAVARCRRRGVRVLVRAARRVRHGVLHFRLRVHDVPRQERSTTRIGTAASDAPCTPTRTRTRSRRCARARRPRPSAGRRTRARGWSRCR